MESEATTDKKSSVLSLDLSDKANLLAAYMPYIKNGGLFVRTDKVYQLGDEVFLLLKLMDVEEKLTTPGKVVWISPKGAQDGLTSGVGVQFSDPENTIHSKIETLLAGHLQLERRTDTM